MLDLGDTLVRDNRVLEHVPASLDAFRQFETETFEPLNVCLVSDFHLASRHREGEIERIFEEFLSILDGLSLRQYFEPTSRHVTLSTHANVMKPDRAVFETALSRLGVGCTLAECLFITENAEHIAACRALGMTCLRFGHDTDTGVSFDDWAIGPLLVNHVVAPASRSNLFLSLRVWFGAVHSIDLISINEGPDRRRVQAAGKQWDPISDARLGDLGELYVQLPVTMSITLDDCGLVDDCVITQPPEEEREAVTAFVGSLAAHGQIAASSSDLARGTTHVLETDEKGRRILKRTRFVGS